MGCGVKGVVWGGGWREGLVTVVVGDGDGGGE